MKRALVTMIFAGLWIACSASGESRGNLTCTLGDTQSCTCAGGAQGTATCTDKLEFGSCVCHGQFEDGGPSIEPSSRLCSARDGGADGGPKSSKKCQVCDFDVAPSDVTICPDAPSCGNGVLGVPSKPAIRSDLTIHTDNGKAVLPDGGVAPPPGKPRTCLDPQLRIRLEKLKVHKGGGEGYCIIEANDGVTSEAAVTMKTSALKDNDEFPFPVGQGTLWGQNLPECTTNNLTLTYYCFKVVDNSAWVAALEAMGNTAAAVGGSPAGGGPYGWAFGLGGAAANAAAAAIAAASKDENRIKVQQTIPVSSLLDLTNGRTWSIRTRFKDGCNIFGCDRDYDWELTVQAWGCADKLPTPR